MKNDLNNLEEKIEELSLSLLRISIKDDEIIKMKKEYYKDLMLSLKIIQKQKEEIIELKIKIIELNEEIEIRDIMRYCK